jgi:hypothetical protein
MPGRLAAPVFRLIIKVVEVVECLGNMPVKVINKLSTGFGLSHGMTL